MEGQSGQATTSSQMANFMENMQFLSLAQGRDKLLEEHRGSFEGRKRSNSKRKEKKIK
jgi:hypothetical protein